MDNFFKNIAAKYDIRLVEAMWILKLFSSEDLPEIAQQALMQGIESEAIIGLASCYSHEWWKIEKDFRSVLNESGGGTMPQLEALLRYARHISQKIVDGELSPKSGGLLINKVSEVDLSCVQEVHDMVCAALEIGDVPEMDAQYEALIVKGAKRLAALVLENDRDEPDIPG